MRSINCFRHLLAASVLVFTAMPAAAGELSAVINGKSYHIDASHDWNEANYGFGLEYQFASASRWKTRVMANGFVDSNDDISYMAGAGIYRNLYASDRFHGLYVDAGINAFLMTRSDVDDNRPFPGALPSLVLGNRHVGFNLSYLPKAAVEKMTGSRVVDETLDGIVFLQFKLSVEALLPAD